MHPSKAGTLCHRAVQEPPSSHKGSSDFPKHLRILKQLGRGAYGTVHLCEDTRTGSQVAVKHVRQAARHGKSMIREIRLLGRLRHENLLHLLDFPAVPSPNFEDVYLVLLYMPADLHRVIQSRQVLGDKHIQAILVQIFRALAHLHGAGVAHRDLKPANILLSSDCKLKICDFGLARGGLGSLDGDDELDQQACGVLTEYVVTRWYRAPEVMLLPKQYTSAVDIWSVGCILGEILGKKALFPGKNHVDMICRVAEVLGSPRDDELLWLPKDTDAYRFIKRVCPQHSGVPLGTVYPNASPECISLLKLLLRWDPNQRLTASDAQEHEYLRMHLPREKPLPPEQFDWTFDSFKPTVEAVKERLYHECARFHPEIFERDCPSRLSVAGVLKQPGQRGYLSASLKAVNLDASPTTYAGCPEKQLPRPIPAHQLSQSQALHYLHYQQIQEPCKATAPHQFNGPLHGQAACPVRFAAPEPISL